MVLTPFELDFSDPHKPRVMVDGENLIETLAIRSIHFDAGPTSFPTVTIYVASAPTVQAEGEVNIRSLDQEADRSARDIVLEWLDSIDPDEVEQRVLSAAVLAEPIGMGFIRALREMAGDGT